MQQKCWLVIVVNHPELLSLRGDKRDENLTKTMTDRKDKSWQFTPITQTHFSRFVTDTTGEKTKNQNTEKVAALELMRYMSVNWALVRKCSSGLKV